MSSPPPPTHSVESDDSDGIEVVSRKSSNNTGSPSPSYNTSETSYYSGLGRPSTAYYYGDPAEPFRPYRTPATYTPIFYWTLPQRSLPRVPLLRQPSEDDWQIVRPASPEVLPFTEEKAIEVLDADKITETQVERLRAQFKVPVKSWNAWKDKSDKPNHPNGDRIWECKNLRCLDTDHRPKCECGNFCCVMKELEDLKNNPDCMGNLRTKTEAKLEDLKKWTGQPHHQNLNTFIFCTECRKYYCPECVGQCPIPICRDRLCKVNPFFNQLYIFSLLISITVLQGT